MNSRYLGILLFVVISSFAQDLPIAPSLPQVQWETVRSDSHSTDWVQRNERGDIAGRYTEVRSGLNRQGTNGWVRATDEIEIEETGAVARKTRFNAKFSGMSQSNLGAFSVGLPENSGMFRGQCLGIAYRDLTTGDSVFIGEVRNVQGFLVGNNEILYPDCFTGIKADIRFRVTVGSFAQDVILREQPPSPESFGMNAASTRLEVWTKIFEAPNAQTAQFQVQTEGGAVVNDCSIDFGRMRIGSGKAFPVDNPQNTPIGREISVQKQYQTVNGEQFLIESVRVPEFSAEVSNLPEAEEASIDRDSLKRAFAARSKGDLKPVSLTSNRGAPESRRGPIRVLAFADLPSSKGYLLDFELVQSVNNMTFRSGVTYKVSGPVSLTGSTVFEGGAVIKYVANSSSKITVESGGVTFQTNMYKPVIMCAFDDHSAGEKLSSETRSGYYADIALKFSPSSTATFGMFTELRISDAKQGIYVSGVANNAQNILRNVQFVHCQEAVKVDLGGLLAVQNVLIHGKPSGAGDTTTAFVVNSGTVSAEHLTVNEAAVLFNTTGTVSLSVVNSVLVNIGNLGTSFTGAPNYVNSSSVGIFQELYQGKHYLSDTSPAKDAGTLSVSADVLSTVRARTTMPPILLTGNNTASIRLVPRSIQDSGMPNLGFHYAPVDYLADVYVTTNADVVLTDGVVVALGPGYGFFLADNCRFISEGKPTRYNQLLDYTHVQEQPVWLDPNPYSGASVIPYHYSAGKTSSAVIRFTEFLASRDRYHVYEGGSFQFSSLSVKDSMFLRGILYLNPPNDTSATALVQNNVFERGNLFAQGSNPWSFYNNLVKDGGIVFDNFVANRFTVKDNAFDNVQWSINIEAVVNGNNAYINTPNRIQPASTSDVVLSSFIYASTGPLNGRFYHASTALENLGSRLASDAGLTHYTTSSSVGTKDGGQVDIGFHYVGVDSTQQPNDFDGDGLWDIAEDLNGNGDSGNSAETGETHWRYIDQPYVTTGEALGPSTRRTPLVVSEIMYNPANPPGKNLEFIELLNTDPYPQDVGEYRIMIGNSILYQFASGYSLEAGGFRVIARVINDVKDFYSLFSSQVIGPAQLDLPNDYNSSAPENTRLRIVNRRGAVLWETTYSDQAPWPIAPDGTGHSLVLARASRGEKGPDAWADSDLIGGSPGFVDPTKSVASEPLRNLRINEIKGGSFVELYNHAVTPATFLGCFLTDDPVNLKKYRISGTDLAGRGYAAFSDPAVVPSTTGGRLYLVNPSATRVLDAVEYGPMESGKSIGRSPNGSDSVGALVSVTQGAANSSPAVPRIVISEIMYDPISGDSDYEFVELHNNTASAINLRRWKVAGGVQFNFPDVDRYIAANGYYMLIKSSKIVTDFRYLPGTFPSSDYSIWTSGKLGNRGDRIILKDENSIVVDDVAYGRGFPWANWAAGGGSSLERVDLRAIGQTPSNWRDSDDRSKGVWGTKTVNTKWELPTAFQSNSRKYLIVGLSGAGECLIDNLNFIRTDTGANLLATENSTMDGATPSWQMYGSYWNSVISQPGVILDQFYNLIDDSSTKSLFLRTSTRSDTGPNCARVPLIQANLPSPSASVAVSFTVTTKWQRGNPVLYVRTQGGYADAEVEVPVPTDLGTPHNQNSANGNVGPTIERVGHTPVLPVASVSSTQPALIEAQITDVDGVTSATLKYRTDPSGTWTSVTMRDDGSVGDRVAQDGIFAARIPAQPSPVLIAFYIEAADGAGVSTASRFPQNTADYCLVRFGEPLVDSPSGFQPPTAFKLPSYRLWMTEERMQFWDALPRQHKEHLDCTVVYANTRVIYNAKVGPSGGYYTSGIMPYTRPDGGMCAYELDFPSTDLLLGSDEANWDWPIFGSSGSDQSATMNRSGLNEQLSFWAADMVDHYSLRRRYFHLFVNGNHQSKRNLAYQMNFFTDPSNPSLGFFGNARAGAKIYEDVQGVNGELLSQIFPGEDDGSLYKADEWFEFDNLADSDGKFVNRWQPKIAQYSTSSTPPTFKDSVYRQFWKQRSTSRPEKYTELKALFDTFTALNEISGADPAAEYLRARFEASFQNIAEAPVWLEHLAICEATGNYDSWGNGTKNVYFYRKPNRKWTILPWDFDATVGSYATWDYTLGIGNYISETPAIDLLNKSYFSMRHYWRKLKEVDIKFTKAYVAAFINPRYDRLKDDSGGDKALGGTYTGDWRNTTPGFGGVNNLTASDRDAVQSWFSGESAGVPTGRRKVVKDALAQSGSTAAAIVAASWSVDTLPTPSQSHQYTVTGTAPYGVSGVYALCNGRTFPGTFISPTAWKVGVTLQSNPSQANSITIVGTNRVGAVLNQSTVSVAYSGAVTYSMSVQITEIMSDNKATLYDEWAGGYKDWIEIHNTSVVPMDISEYRLRDSTIPAIDFVFPAGTVIPAGGYVLVWADDYPQNTAQPANGTLHAPFAVANNGETVKLLLPFVDTPVVSFVASGVQNPDVSSGLPRSGGVWTQLRWPSPNTVNPTAP